MSRDLPSGTVTFLFSDVEGSTALLHELGTGAYAHELSRHRKLVREVIASHGGVEVGTEGDSFFVAFPTAIGAVQAAADIQRALEGGRIRLRIGIHTGSPLIDDDDYVGVDVHRAARVAAAGHGGQVLISAPTAALVERDDLVDLGLHRLKDLTAAERIYQLGSGEFPRLRTLHQTNLPVPTTPFVGRSRELAEIVTLLERSDVRVLTLTGPGGTGKTRLALQAAGGVADRYPDGVWWVGLAPVRDPTLVPSAIAQVLGAQRDLATHIGERRMLLLLDNFEQVVAAASEVAALVASCPNLGVVATSREPLRLQGEHEYPVPSLAPDDSGALFVARARAVDPSYQIDGLVGEICERLDHLPLAVELAAARVRMLSPVQILERLDARLELLTGGARDAPERQRTLRATIEWSYDLLNADEQRLFRRLGVFRGGCTLSTAEEVADTDVDTIGALVQKSLVRFREGRFWMLEAIREYAEDRLEEAGEAAETRQRHATHFLTLAEEAYPHLTGSPKEWLDRLEAERDNLRAALEQLSSSGQAPDLLRLAGALWRFWYQRVHLAEGRRWLETALDMDRAPTTLRARALNGATGLAMSMGDLETAEVRVREALDIYGALGDAWGIVNSRYLLGVVLAERGEYGSAEGIFREAVEAFGDLGDDHMGLMALRALAWMREELGDLEGYRALRMEHLRLARETGNERAIALGLRFMAGVANDAGRIGEAVSLLREGAET
ncbi:MAG: adenylate/guanylate cyclase domain-containing protein, partial [Acidimicrobiia bacterium]